MGSSGKRKTTMAKLNRERKLQERRRDKAARKDARRSSPEPSLWGSALTAEEPLEPDDTQDRQDAHDTQDRQDAHDTQETRDQPEAPSGVEPHELA